METQSNINRSEKQDQYTIKGELQCENKLISHERAFKMLENDISL